MVPAVADRASAPAAAAPIPAVALADVVAALPAEATEVAPEGTATSSMVVPPLAAAAALGWPVSEDGSPGGEQSLSPASLAASDGLNAALEADGQSAFGAAAPTAPEPTLTKVNVDDGEDIVGEGAYSTVHVGHWLGTKVAVKVPRTHGPSLDLEAETLTQLRHPCICRFMGTMLHKNRLAIVMEYLEGGPLDRFLQLDVPPPQRRALSFGLRIRMAREAASGLAFLHARGYVHRDIKPANILITADYHAKIADFGISKHLPFGTPSGGSGGSSHARLEWTNTPGVGTMRYMAPEVMVLNDENVSVSAGDGVDALKHEPGAMADGGGAASPISDMAPPTRQVAPLAGPKLEPKIDSADEQNKPFSTSVAARYGAPCDVYSFGLVS